jgi:septal ring factor EnvC (AmiA/AmiB activator)
MSFYRYSNQGETMAKIDQIATSLEKLYAKRDAVRKEIATAEKKLLSEARKLAKPRAAKKPGKKAPAKKAAAPGSPGQLSRKPKQ